MTNHERFSSWLLPVGMIVVAALTRILPHAPNFTPIGAIALFAGAHLNKKWRFVVPIAAMIISDIVIGLHDTMVYVYGSFILTIFIGMYLQHKKSVLLLGLGSIGASVLFFVITNFGVWAASNMYSKDIAGLMEAYALGLPFFRNTLLSDFLFSFILFFGYQALVTIESTRYRFSRVKSQS